VVATATTFGSIGIASPPVAPLAIDFYSEKQLIM